MTKKSTPPNQQEGENQAEPILKAETVSQLADKWFEEMRPYLFSDGEILLGKNLSVLMASIAQLREAQAVNSEGFSQVTNLIQELTARHRTTTQSISQRLERLEGSDGTS